MESLEKLREEINIIDQKLVELFEERVERILKIKEIKEERSLPVMDPDREREVLERTRLLLKDQSLSPGLEEFFLGLLKVSRRLQEGNKESKTKEIIIEKSDVSQGAKECTIGFQGFAGSFSEEALNSYFGDQVPRKMFYNFEDVFQALNRREIDYGILPMENSFTGGIYEVYDLFRRYPFYIVGEKIVKVEQHLLVTPDARIEDIREVYSHPQAFIQSQVFLKSFPQWKLVPYHNTAISAAFVRDQGERSIAAIGSRKAAQLYGLKIARENINSARKNYTRFVIVGREMEPLTDVDKISLVFSLEHRPGTLYHALKYLADQHLNLLKLESRPEQETPWEYLFYLDFSGNLKNLQVQESLELLKQNSRFFRLLGNYKGDRGI